MKKLLLINFCLLGLIMESLACTVFFASNSNNLLVGNNEDFSNPKTCMWYSPAKDGKYSAVFFGFKNFPYNIVYQGGMNEKGLFIDWAWHPKFPIEYNKEVKSNKFLDLNLTGNVLQKCSNVKEAVELIKKRYPKLWRQAHCLIADSEGNSVILEASESGFTVIPRERYFQVITNHPLIRPIKYTCDRYNLVNEMFNTNNEVNVQKFKEILEIVSTSETRYSNIYDLKNKIIYLYSNHNFNDVLVINLQDELRKGNRKVGIPQLFPNRKIAIDKINTINGLAYGINESIPYTGDFVEYSSNNKLKSSGSYYGGYKTGKWEYFDENGKIIRTDVFSHNYEYYYNGQVKSEQFYKNNKLEGKSIWYYENGKTREKSNFRNGFYDDQFCFYNEDGTLTFKGVCKDSIFYQEGNINPFNGKISLKLNNGIVAEEFSFENGKKNGQVVVRNKNGQVTQERYYSQNKKTGVWKWYYDSSDKLRLANYSDDMLNGDYFKWFENGQLNYKAFYLNGKAKKEKWRNYTF